MLEEELEIARLLVVGIMAIQAPLTAIWYNTLHEWCYVEGLVLVAGGGLLLFLVFSQVVLGGGRNRVNRGGIEGRMRLHAALRGARRGMSALDRRLQLLFAAEDHDFGPEDYEALLELDEDTPTKRLQAATPSDLARLPEFQYSASKSSQTSSSSSSPSSSSSKPTVCKICLGTFEEGERLRLLPCLHQFHTTCADRWLVEKAECPICKTSIRVSAHAEPSSSSSSSSSSAAVPDTSNDEHLARMLALEG